MIPTLIIFPKEEGELWSEQDIQRHLPSIPPAGTILVIEELEYDIPQLGFQVTEARYDTNTHTLEVYVIPSFLTSHKVHNPYQGEKLHD